MFRLVSKILLSTFSVCAFPLLANAQSGNAVANAFSGEWITYDRAFAKQGNCKLSFSAAKKDAYYPIQPSNCIGGLASIAGWRIENNQLVFVDPANKPLALVGGNQQRLSGSIIQNAQPIVIEKAEFATKIEKARKSIQCSYVGYGQVCAKPRQFAPPAIAPGSLVEVKVLVKLNARTEPRNNAAIVSVLPQNSCHKTSACTLASDGLWCRIESKGKQAWIKKQTVRQKKWPIITFVNGC